MMFDDKQLEQARRHLLGPGSDNLIEFMQYKSLAWHNDGISSAALQSARTLDWISGPNDSLTARGFLVADSCREYRFWLGRGKALPFENIASHLSRDYFLDRRVLEIGSGMGVNLMSLATAGIAVCGVEPEEAYVRLGSIFCEREGLLAPDVRQGVAEILPLEDNEVDLVLCISSHQYFDIRPAFAEIARVLKPGGELIIIGRTLGTYFQESLAKLISRRSRMKGFAVTIINTLSYMAQGRKIVFGQANFTSRPIYPTRMAMRRWQRDAGFEEINPTCRVGSATCFHNQRQAFDTV